MNYTSTVMEPPIPEALLQPLVRLDPISHYIRKPYPRGFLPSQNPCPSLVLHTQSPPTPKTDFQWGLLPASECLIQTQVQNPNPPHLPSDPNLVCCSQTPTMTLLLQGTLPS